MKTYTIIKGFFAVGVLSVVLSGCSEDAMDRINKDHGHTQSVAARFILTDVITSTAFSNAGGDFNTYLSAQSMQRGRHRPWELCNQGYG